MLKTVITEPRSHTWWPVGHIWLSDLIGLAGLTLEVVFFCFVLLFFLVMGWMLIFKTKKISCENPYFWFS